MQYKDGLDKMHGMLILQFVLNITEPMEHHADAGGVFRHCGSKPSHSRSGMLVPPPCHFVSKAAQQGLKQSSQDPQFRWKLRVHCRHPQCREQHWKRALGSEAFKVVKRQSDHAQ